MTEQHYLSIAANWYRAAAGYVARGDAKMAKYCRDKAAQATADAEKVKNEAKQSEAQR